MMARERSLTKRSDYAYEDEQGEHWGARLLREILEVAVITLLLFMAVRLLVQNYRVEGPSMTPTLLNTQYILVNKADYYFSGPQRGDVVVFQAPAEALAKCPPNGDAGQTNPDFVKRIIGLPGDTVKIQPNGGVFVDNTLLNEPYINSGPSFNDAASWHLGSDQYFVMGDNRGDSCDSREWGPVPRQDIIGKASVVYWPLSNFHFVPSASSVFAQVHQS
jgi:signal peptidase I